MSVTPDSVRLLLQSSQFGDRLQGVNQLRSLDSAVAFELVQSVVADSNVRVRYAAVSQMASLGVHDLACSQELLTVALGDAEADVQAAAADALSALKITDAFEAIAQLYHSTSDWLVQFSIVAALGALGEPRAFELLTEALGSEQELLQTGAIGSLGELADARAIPLLLPFVTHTDWQIRFRVVQALANFETPEVRSALATLATDEIEQVAQLAQGFLKAS